MLAFFTGEGVENLSNFPMASGTKVTTEGRGVKNWENLQTSSMDGRLDKILSWKMQNRVLCLPFPPKLASQPLSLQVFIFMHLQHEVSRDELHNSAAGVPCTTSDRSNM